MTAAAFPETSRRENDMFGKDKEAAEQKSAPQAAATPAQEARPAAAPAGASVAETTGFAVDR